MRVLAIDASARRGGVAVASGDNVLASRLVDAKTGFGDVLYPLIQEALATAGLRLQEIDLFAAASGPGSFTGVRVGLTAAKALAEALGKPAVGVSNLEALAFAAETTPCAAVLDARRHEVYGAVYGSELRPLVEETVLDWEVFWAKARELDPVWVSTQASIFEADGAAALPAGARRQVVDDLPAAIALLASRKLSIRSGAPELVEANYIRRPDAERNWKGP